MLLGVVVYLWSRIAAAEGVTAALKMEQQRLLQMVHGLEQQVAVLKRSSAGVTESVAASPAPGVPLIPVPLKAAVAPSSAPPAYVAPKPLEQPPEYRPAPGMPVFSQPVQVPIAAEKVSLEHRLGTNWLNRIGIALLVFGVAFFLAYQFTHIGPLGKIVSGYLLAVVLLGGGLWLERKPKFQIFARAGIGGGWALIFFTTFAMHYIPATAVLNSEFVDLVLLFFAAAGMVLHSLRYRSQVVTSLAFLLAFATVTISHQTLYSLLGSAILAIGLEVVCSTEGWYVLEIAGILAAYSNHFLWLSRTVHEQLGPGHPFAEFWPSTLVLLLFFVVFRVGYVLRKPADEHTEALSSMGAVLNAVIVMAVMKYQSFHPQWAFLALLVFGVVEFGFAFAVRRRGRRAAFSVLATIASVLVMAAVPFKYGGATWPLLWVLEGEALWLAGFFTRERVLRLLGSLGLLAAVVKLSLVDVLSNVPATMLHRGLVMGALLLAATCLWANAEVLSRRLTLHEATAEDAEHYAGSAVAAFATMLTVWVATGNWTAAWCWSLLAVVLFAAGVWRRSMPLRLEAYAALAAGCVRLLAVDFPQPLVAVFGKVDRAEVAAAIVMACCLCIAEWQRRLAAADGITPAEGTWVGGAMMSAAGVVLSSLLYLELPAQWLAAGWALMALLQTAGALRRDGVRPRLQAVVLALLVVARVAVVNQESEVWRRWPAWCAAALLFAAVPLAFRLRRTVVSGELRHVVSRPEQVVFFAPLAIVLLSLLAEFHGGMLTIAVSTLGVVVFLVALAINERSFRLAGLGLLLAGVAKLLLWDVWQMPASERYLSLIVVGIALLAVSFLYSKFADRLKQLL